MKLYYTSNSGNAYKVRILLSLLNVPHEKVLVDTRNKEHKQPPFLKLNPRGEVPVIEDNGTVIWDSAACLAYVARKHGGDQWLPADPAGMAQVMQWVALAGNEIQYGLLYARRGVLQNRWTAGTLEQGQAQWTYPHFAHDHDSLRYSVRYALMVDLQRETWTWRPDQRSPALPMRQYGTFNPGMGLGGAAVHWSAQLWRFLDTDFRYRSHVIERYGQTKIPAGCTVQDWGVTYEELEPYYDAFEWDIGASGQAGNINGKKIRGGNPFESPRSRGYPNPPLQVTPHGANFADACESLGLSPFTQPSGIVSRAWTDPHGNHRGGCLYCGFCTRYRLIAST